MTQAEHIDDVPTVLVDRYRRALMVQVIDTSAQQPVALRLRSRPPPGETSVRPANQGLTVC